MLELRCEQATHYIKSYKVSITKPSYLKEVINNKGMIKNVFWKKISRLS